MRYLSASAQHAGAREYQQDSFGLAGGFAGMSDPEFLRHAGCLTVLCDGMGGMAHGDIASKIAVQATLEAYARKTPEESIPDALERAVHEANRQVIEEAERLGAAEGVGTTLVAAVLHQDHQALERVVESDVPDHQSLYFISVGDSGLFLFSGGQLQVVNQPHVYANVLDRAVANGVISQDQADQHPERESLTSFVGIQTLQEIDRNTEPWPVRTGDTILLASDGMFKTLEPHEIRAALEGDPLLWPQELVDRVLKKQRPGQDNVTVVSVSVVSATDASLITDLPAPSVFKRGLVDVAAPEVPSAALPSTARPSRFLLVALLLVLLALAIAGLWYFYSLRGSSRLT